MRRRTMPFAAIATLLLVPAVVLAQENASSETLQRGRRSLAFSVGNSNSIGFWTMVSDVTNIGIDAYLGYADTDLGDEIGGPERPAPGVAAEHR